MASSLDRRKSRYTQGGDTETYTSRIAWWERREFEKDSSDIYITLTDRTHLRPDLLSYDIYGDVSYSWVLLQYNNILDINTEFTAGTEIVAPSPERLIFTMMNKSTGGTQL